MTKVSTNFRLKQPESKKPTPIRLNIHYANQRLIYYIGESIEPDFWENEKQRPRNVKGFDRYLQLKERLEFIEKKVPKVVLDYQNTHEGAVPSTGILKEILDEVIKKIDEDKPDTPERLTLLPWVKKFIDDSKKGTRTIPKTGKHYSAGSIKNFTTVYKVLLAFEKSLHTTLEFDAVDLHIYQKLIAYLNRQGYATNQKGNVIKYLKVFMKQSMKDGLHTNIKFQDGDFSKPSEEVESIYLNESELNRFFDLDLTGKPGLDRVRDLFLMGCNTGLRFSDIGQVRNDNIISNANGQILKVRTQKTDKVVYVPVTYQLRAILDKYKGGTPKPISNQKMNDHLKVLAKMADLTEPVAITRTKGGKRVTVNRPKWELVTTHTARRSFATNAYLNGVPTLDIMMLTGHKTETSFMKYIKITEEETANRLLEHPFFKRSAIRIAQ